LGEFPVDDPWRGPGPVIPRQRCDQY